MTTLKVKTVRFGEIELESETALTIQGGLLGFPDSERYAMLDHEPESPFKWLQSLDEPELAFVVTDPLVFVPDYHIQVRKEDLVGIEVQDKGELTILVVLSLKGEAKDMTANLQGPIIANTRTRVGRQIVLRDSEYLTKHHLFPELRKAG